MLIALLSVTPAIAKDRIGDIEFFGYKGLDLASIRAAVPVHKGDQFSEGAKDAIREAVTPVIGTAPTDVAAICCDEHGDTLLFIGLPGESSKGFVLNTEPTGRAHLPASLIDLYRRLDAALEAAVRRGGNAAQEDDSQGYSLIADPTARALELAVRGWALEHEQLLIDVLASSSDVQQRRIAGDALGYGHQSRQQTLALVRAARDPDKEVRNNVTRALGVLLRSKGQFTGDIQPDTFIEMLNSGQWTDRNKAAALLAQLTEARNPAILARIRSAAFDSLIEMASWRRSSHAYFARIVLGRIAGLPEEQLQKLAWDGPVEAIVDAAGRR